VLKLPIDPIRRRSNLAGNRIERLLALAEGNRFELGDVSNRRLRLAEQFFNGDRHAYHANVGRRGCVDAAPSGVATSGFALLPLPQHLPARDPAICQVLLTDRPHHV
jgi:hypothetical protein